jgi:hypothetical protein
MIDPTTYDSGSPQRATGAGGSAPSNPNFLGTTYRKITPEELARIAAENTVPKSEQAIPSGFEKVNHPAHYGGADNPYEAIKVIEAWLRPLLEVAPSVAFHIGTCLRYIARAGLKPGETPIDDLKKARWYLDRAIVRLEKLGG